LTITGDTPSTHARSEEGFRLAYRGVRLGDDKTLRELRLPDEASLVCILTPAGGVGGGPAAVAAAAPAEEKAAATDKAKEKEKEKEKTEEERRLAEQERAVSAIEVKSSRSH